MSGPRVVAPAWFSYPMSVPKSDVSAVMLPMLRWGAGRVSRSRIPIPASRVPSFTCKEWPNNWYNPHTISIGVPSSAIARKS